MTPVEKGMTRINVLLVGTPLAGFLQEMADLDARTIEDMDAQLYPAEAGEELIGPMTELEQRMYCTCKQRVLEAQQAWRFFDDGKGMECGICRGCEFLEATSPCAALRLFKHETALRQHELELTIRRRLPAAAHCIVRQGFILYKRKPARPYDVSQEAILWSGGFPF